MQKKTLKTIVRIVSLLLTGLFLTIGLILLLLSLGQYETLQGFLNQFAPDGNLESFTAVLHTQLRIPLLFIGGILFILGGASVTFRTQYKAMLEETFQWIPLFLKALWEDTKDFFQLLVPEKLAWWEWALFAIILLLAIAGRWALIEQPMSHDESYTFIAFARYPVRQIISDYHLPNNHIVNSLLIHVFYQLFGNPSPAIVRGPAFISGFLVCISTYFFARREFGKWEALLLTTFMAVLPRLIDQSVNGRGYMLMALFTLWMYSLAVIVQRKRNRFAWLLLIMVTVLNFWTIPVALYPFGIFATWLLVSALVGDIADEYEGLWNFLKYFITYGISSGIITFLLYTPIFLIGSGWNSLFNNSFVSSLTWNAFRQTLPVRLSETWQLTIKSLPLLAVIFLVAGFTLFVVLRRSTVKYKVSLPLVTVIVLAGIFIIQRPNPWPKIWTYLVPLMMIWSVLGWYALMKRGLPSEVQATAIPIFSIVVVVAMLTFGVVHLTQNLDYFKGEKGAPETITLWLKDKITDEDYVFISVTYGPTFWYYFDRHELPLDTVLNMNERDWKRVFFVVDDRDNAGHEELIEEKKPITINQCPSQSVEQIYQYGHYTVFVCDSLVP